MMKTRLQKRKRQAIESLIHRPYIIREDGTYYRLDPSLAYVQAVTKLVNTEEKEGETG